MNFVIRITAPLALLALVACGGGSGSDDAPPAGSGGSNPPPAAATAPTITTQPLAQSVAAPEPATFSVIASGTAPLAYQWRSSTDGTSWIDIAGATGASYATGATEVGMNGRYYSVVVSNSAGSVASSSAQLTAIAATPPPTGGGGPSGEFPHAANPLAIAVTPADDALSNFDVSSSADATVRVPGGASGIIVADGVTVSFGFPGDTFLEDQSLAVTRVALAGLDSAHPLPFQSVIGAFDIDPADTTIPELRTNNLVRVTFTLTQEALDALGGQPVIFSARSDGTQLHIVPVFASDGGTWSTLMLTTSVDHLGIFGIATLSDEQAAALAVAWPSDDDLQLEAAVAPPSYELRKAVLSNQATAFASRVRLMAAARIAASSTQDDWAAQMQARIDAYYNDEVVPALNAADAVGADIAQFRDATQKILTWERMRQLLELQDDRDVTVMQRLADLAQRGLEKAMQDCSANQNTAAAVQALGMLRQLALLGIETDTTSQSVLDTCGRSTYDVSVSWTQVHNDDYDLKADPTPETAFTGKMRLTTTVSGNLHLSGSTPELTSVILDVSSSFERNCADGAYLCTNERSSMSAHESDPVVSQCGAYGFYGSYRVERWNLDARGHVAGPYLYVTFQNAFQCAGSSFNVATSRATQTDYDSNGNASSKTTNAGDTLDTAPWSGGASLGSSSRIVRRSAAITGENIVPGSIERWTTSITFKITEVPPSN
jgi:hypothetical protein